MSFEGEHITDTSVLMYFLLADDFELLLKLLGSPIQVPIDVYEPEDAQTENAWQWGRGEQREDMLSTELTLFLGQVKPHAWQLLTTANGS